MRCGKDCDLSSFSLEGCPGCFPDSVSDFMSFGYVDNDRETAVVSDLERRGGYEFLDLGGAFRWGHHGTDGF